MVLGGGWKIWERRGQSVSEGELDPLYAQRFIIYHLSAQKPLGLDFGPSFPV